MRTALHVVVVVGQIEARRASRERRFHRTSSHLSIGDRVLTISSIGRGLSGGSVRGSRSCVVRGRLSSIGAVDCRNHVRRLLILIVPAVLGVRLRRRRRSVVSVPDILLRRSLRLRRNVRLREDGVGVVVRSRRGFGSRLLEKRVHEVVVREIGIPVTSSRWRHRCHRRSVPFTVSGHDACVVRLIPRAIGIVRSRDRVVALRVPVQRRRFDGSLRSVLSRLDRRDIDRDSSVCDTVFLHHRLLVTVGARTTDVRVRLFDRWARRSLGRRGESLVHSRAGGSSVLCAHRLLVARGVTTVARVRDDERERHQQACRSSLERLPDVRE